MSEIESCRCDDHQPFAASAAVPPRGLCDPYPAGHPQYYTGQILLSLSEGYADGKGGELTLTGTRPNCGTYQMDVYPNATAADVRSGRIAIHPGNPQAVSELSHTNGSTGACVPVVPPVKAL